MLSEPGKSCGKDLGSLADRFGLGLSADQIGQLNIFLDELEVWNRKINLTGPRSRKRIINELLLDSLLPAPLIPARGRLLDIGSGAGFPAIPIKISSPALECDLVEPNSKKVSFLRQVIRLVGLKGIRVIRGRIEEEKGSLHPRRYHAITSRAVAPLPSLLTWARPHLAPGGMIVAFLGKGGDQALLESGEIMSACNLSPFRRVQYCLPGKDSERTLVILKRDQNRP